MGIVLKFLSGPFGIYALIAVACLVGGSLAYGYTEHLIADNARLERDTAVNEAKQLRAALDGKDGVIDQLNRALDNWKENATRATAAQLEAGKAALRYRNELSVANERLRTQRENDRALPDCQVLMDTDLAAVCPGTAASLREWAKRSLQRSADREAGAGAGAD